MLIENCHGVNVPKLGFGTWELRDEICSELVTHAISVGYRHIDTAIFYHNEEAVGEGIRKGIADNNLSRDDIFLTTKIWPDNCRKGDLEAALEGSLERLNVGLVDLALIHWPPKNFPVTEAVEAINDAKDKGLCKNIGVSNFTVPQLKEALSVTRHPILCNQVEYHPRLSQDKLLPFMRENKIALVSYCPLSRGGALFDNPIVTDLADKYNKTPAQIILRWHMDQDGVMAIPRTKTPSRAAQNFDIEDFSLTADEVASLSALATPDGRICDYDFSPDWD
jgi:diketogulonate reductase-like aldo/keto reductase